MGERSNIRPVLFFWICLLPGMLLMVVWHEVIGHDLVGILAGGHITGIDLFGVRLLPKFGWSGIPGRIICDNIENIPETGRNLAVLAGPLSTWCVSVLAVVLLWVKRWKGLMYVILVCLSLWCYDILTETLSIWGLPRGIWFHNGRFFLYSRGPIHYEAAVRLGVHSSLFVVFGIGTSVCLLAGLVIRLILDHKQRRQ